jgi:hypothetical protein
MKFFYLTVGLVITTILGLNSCGDSIKEIPVKNSQINEKNSDLKEWIKVSGETYKIEPEDNNRIRISINFKKLNGTNTTDYDIKDEDFYIIPKDINDNIITDEDGDIIKIESNYGNSLLDTWLKVNEKREIIFVYYTSNKIIKNFLKNIDYFDIYCKVTEKEQEVAKPVKKSSNNDDEDIDKLLETADKLNKLNSDAMKTLKELQ